MALGGVYNTGTVTFASTTLVNGTGTLWVPVVEIGDWILVNGQVGVISAINSNTQIVLETPWQGALPSGATYAILLMSWLRYDPALTQSKTRELLIALDDQGKFWFVETPPPDPGLGDDGHWALYTVSSPWRVWLKVSGSWVEQAGPAATIANDQVIPDHLNADTNTLKAAFWRRLHPPAASRSSNTAITADDHARFIEATSTFTQTFPDAGTLDSTWWMRYLNRGTGIITFSGDTFNGISSFPLYPGEDVIITIANGEYKLTGLSGRVLLGTSTASSSSVIDFAPLPVTRFKEFEVSIHNVRPATAGANFNFRTSSDGGSNYGTTGYNHSRQVGQTGGGNTAGGAANTSEVVLFSGLGSTSDDQTGGILRLNGFEANFNTITWNLIGLLNSPAEWCNTVGGARVGSSVNGIRFFFSAGNIAVGTFKLYGLA